MFYSTLSPRNLVKKFKKKFIRYLEDHRGLVILIFCLPISFLFDAGLKFRNWLNGFLYSAPEKHDERVRKIQKQVATALFRIVFSKNKRVKKRNRLPNSQKRLMCTSRPNWLSLSTTFFRKDKCHNIDVNLFDILSLDEVNKIVRVEPLVSVRDITKYLVPRGYSLAVTLEIGDATCGGLAMAVGMTTHSHKVGLYQETVTAYEIILSNGTLVRATANNQHSDLYYSLPWSHGTLGFLVAVELKIIPIKPYVRLRYIPVVGQKNYCDMMRNLSGALDEDVDTPDFLEATAYSRNTAVIMVGNFSDVKSRQEKRKINQVAKWYKPWFYKHAETFLKKGEGEEFIPITDYLLRHNRAIFWVMESMVPFGNNFIFRFLFGWLFPAKPAFLKFTTTRGIRAMTFTKQVFQDIVLPMTVLEKSIDLTEKLFDTYPLLIYPCRIYDHGIHSGQLRPPKADQMTPGTNYGMFFDLGVYGTPGPVKRREKYDAVYSMRSMEKFIREVGGYSFLYADLFMIEEEFEEMFDLTLYNNVRMKYGAVKAFPNLYDKVKPEIDVFSIGRQYSENN